MIKSITAINYLGKELTLELAAPEKSGLWVKSIDGVGPGKASINVTNMASNDGGIFNSARAETRNIELTLGMYDIKIGDSDWSIERSRLLTYEYFPKKRWVKLIFETDERFVYIDGYVESNEPDIFEKRETTSISIICPDPNFYDFETYVVDLAEVTNNFEFPGVPESSATGYSNESTTENLTEFGLISTDISQTNIDYQGEVETGLYFKIKCLGVVQGFRLYNVQTTEKIEINDTKISAIVENGISAGDTIEICTIKGNKYATLTRDGDTYNIINSLGMNPNWFQLYKDDNIFGFYATQGASSVEIQMQYRLAYEGI